MVVCCNLSPDPLWQWGIFSSALHLHLGNNKTAIPARKLVNLPSVTLVWYKMANLLYRATAAREQNLGTANRNLALKLKAAQTPILAFALEGYVSLVSIDSHPCRNPAHSEVTLRNTLATNSLGDKAIVRDKIFALYLLHREAVSLASEAITP